MRCRVLTEVDWLQRELESAGIAVWRDREKLWPGDEWRSRIRDAIAVNAVVFIVCFSSRSVARTTSYQNEEIRLAVEQVRRRPPGAPWLIPVRLGDCDIPDFELGPGVLLPSQHPPHRRGAGADTWAEQFALDSLVAHAGFSRAICPMSATSLASRGGLPSRTG